MLRVGMRVVFSNTAFHIDYVHSTINEYLSDGLDSDLEEFLDCSVRILIVC